MGANRRRGMLSAGDLAMLAGSMTLLMSALTAGSGPGEEDPIGAGVRETIMMLAEAPQRMEQARADASVYVGLVDPNGPYAAALEATGGMPWLPAVPGLRQVFELDLPPSP